MCVLFQGLKLKHICASFSFVVTVRLSLYVAKHGLEILGSSDPPASASLETGVIGIVTVPGYLPVLKHAFLFLQIFLTLQVGKES